MCNISCIDFGKACIKKEEVKGKAVIEIGSYNVNGSLRSIIEALEPDSYIGIDIESGPGVDQICEAEDITKTFGYNRFDMVICTEVLEHVKNWQSVIHNIKSVIKPGGILLITTRSRGFVYHGFPADFWRYEKSDMEFIFSDFDIEALESDPIDPGVFFKARKPVNFIENKLENYKLYSIIQGRRTLTATPSIYWSVVGFPIWKLFGRTKYSRKIIHYITHPSDIPRMMQHIYTKLTGKTNHP
ncbi:MAG TPA: methyltransferase type 11 [Phycisphaerales bacterium]|nr:MAG: hypothetical protein A2Y13_08425 [Planctomycetes bacterium GWC2_45_44]HBG78406.1 methyltransferase type 11 [Phycisphaerales bacterium]HBR19689.1 methyltransferase type 11 [Phycisphaerales bacterium]